MKCQKTFWATKNVEIFARFPTKNISVICLLTSSVQLGGK